MEGRGEDVWVGCACEICPTTRTNGRLRVGRAMSDNCPKMDNVAAGSAIKVGQNDWPTWRVKMYVPVVLVVAMVVVARWRCPSPACIVFKGVVARLCVHKVRAVLALVARAAHFLINVPPRSPRFLPFT